MPFRQCFVEPLEFFLVGEVDFDAAALALAHDSDARAQRDLAAGPPRRVCWDRPFREAAAIGRRRSRGAPCASVSRTERPRDTTSRATRRCAASSARVTSARAWPIVNAPDDSIAADFRGQFEQPHVVGDRRAILADGGGNGFLRHLEFVGEPAVGLRFFDRIQIFALDVFDQRDFEQALVRHVAIDDGNFQQARALRGAPAALARHDLGAVADAAHENRLNHAVRCESTAPALRAALRPCARGAGADSASADRCRAPPGRAAARSRAWRAARRRGGNQRAQSAAKCGTFVSHVRSPGAG